MKTERQTRLILPGSRARVYEIDLVDKGGPDAARFLVNFRYGWQGGVLEEGTRTPEPLTEAAAIQVFDSLIVARRNQGYLPVGEAAPPATTPVLTAVPPRANAREVILAARLRGLDGLSDIKAAALIRRIGELRMNVLAHPLAAATQSLLREGKRLVALRSLPYALHRCDDGTSAVAAALAELAACADRPTAETAGMLCFIRDPKAAPSWETAPLVLRTAAALPEAAARNAATAAYFQAVAAEYGRKAGATVEASASATSALRALYVVGAHDPQARDMSLAGLAAAPLQPPLFQAIRRIWQVSEATDDADVLALLIARFDNERSTVRIFKWQRRNPQTYVDGRLVSVAEQLVKPAARIAYTDRTRAYLRRRGWRNLRRLGKAGDAAYTRIASAILLTLDETGEKPVPARSVFRYDARTRTRDAATWRYPLFADRYAAQFILNAHNPRLAQSTRTLRWRFTQLGEGETAGRVEAFPKLWDGQPALLWHLVTAAKADTVAAFAGRALIANTAYVDGIASAEIARLLLDGRSLSSRYGFALQLAERRISAAGLTPDIAAALMRDPVRGAALIKLHIGARPELLAANAPLFAAILTGCSVENHAWFDGIAVQGAALAAAPVRPDILARTLAIIEAEDWSADQQPRALALAALLSKLFPAEIAALDANIIRRLDQNAAEPIRLVAAILASARPDGAALVDVGRLALSPNPDLRAAGIALFGQRSLDLLVADLATIAAFLSADAAEPRRAARPIAARIASERPDAARLLAEMLLPALYRAEAHDGLRDDVYGVLVGELWHGVIALGPETVWALLRARSEPARRLGAAVLGEFKPTDFGIRQLARIGCNDQVKARTWAVASLQARIEDVRAAPQDGFALLDCEFDDSREAGYALYRGALKPEDWTPEALVALSDLITEPAQRFGREMIGRVFEARNAEFLLSRLAEHPAPGFRLLVARLMRDYVKDDSERLRRLIPTIETTLMQVRRSRAAKDQIFAFIEEQIARDTNTTTHERTAILAPVLERSVATCATADRARALSLLAALKQTHPDLAPRAVIVPREARR